MAEVSSQEKLFKLRDRLKKEQRWLLRRRFFSNKMAFTGCMITLILAVFAMIAPILSPYSPYELSVMNRLQGPSLQHLLGTDNFGRDLLTRIAYGARVSLGIGFVVAVLSAFFGVIIGLYAAYYRALDGVLMRICDGLMAIPAILLAIALMATLGADIKNIIICLSIVFTPYIARVVRSAALVVREQTYTEAIKSLGAPSWRIIWLHIAPNTISPLIVQATFIFAETIIIEGALSFLGVGVPAPDPSWGNIIFDSKLVILKAWWMTVFPGIAIILSVLGLNLFGDGLRDFLDPHTSQAKSK